MKSLPIGIPALAAALLAVGALSHLTSARADIEFDSRDVVRHVVPRDAIPSLSLPQYDSIKDAGYMRPGDRVIALEFEGKQLAYPVRILDHHEIINDLVGGKPILVTY